MNPAAPRDDDEASNNGAMDDSPPEAMDDSEMQELEVVQNPPVVTIGRGIGHWPRVPAGGGIPTLGMTGMIPRGVGGGNEDEDEDDDDEDDDDDDDDDDEDADGEEGELILGEQDPPFNFTAQPQLLQQQPLRGRKPRKQNLSNNNLVQDDDEDADARHLNGHDDGSDEHGVLNDDQRRRTRRMTADATVIAQEPQITSSTANAAHNGEIDEEEDDARSQGTFRYIVPNISKLKETALSGPYYVRNLPWKIMVMLRAQPNADKTMSKSLGFFLQCNADSESASWSCNATADLRMLKHNGEEPFSRRISHLFYSKENDWGFSHFMSWNDIVDPEKGFVKDDAITLEVHVVADAPHGVSWDSKKHTGYVGLKNQGATCYMNSLLQVLYFTNHLRRAVYKMPTESDDSARSVPLALQRVFYELQFTDKPVGTKKLTKSFGWETLDSFMQHDVQEFLRVLLDNLESKMKRTSVEGTIPKLFEGKMISYIKCKHVDYASSRTEPFYDVQLNVKGKKNLYESFRDYVEVETLEGENRYDAGPLGMQDAVKGVQFTQFPPVLYLHLMRFMYDPMTDTNVKINDRYEFPANLDLTEFLKTEDENAPKATYTLHAVLVHSGDNHGGHYVVFINPKGDGKWCKFDDDVVSKCSKAEAIDNNFGGTDEDLGLGVKHCTNAYMLVYIRDSDLSWALGDVTDRDIPTELTERINEEKRLEMVKRRERNEGHQYMSVQMLTDDDFTTFQYSDLFDADKLVQRKIFRVKKLTLLKEFEELLADAYKYPANCVRIWPVIQRPNGTMRPAQHPRLLPTRTLAEVSEATSPWVIYVEFLPPDSPQRSLPDLVQACLSFLFCKLYVPETQRLYFLGSMYVPRGRPLRDIGPKLRAMAGFAPETELLLYEEVRPGHVEEIGRGSSDIPFLPQDGDIIVFQRGDMAYLEQLPTELSTAAMYYLEMCYRVEVIFIDKNAINESGVRTTLSQRSTYNDMAKKVAERLNVDPECIQFFRTNATNAYRDTPGAAIRNDAGVLKDFLSFNKPRPKKLYYQLLSVKLNELERKRQIKCAWVSMNCKEEREITLYPNKTGTVRDLLDEASRNPAIPILGPERGGSGKLRLLEVAAFKIQNVVAETVSLADIPNSQSKQLRIEEIPIDEAPGVMQNNEVLMPCAHYHKDTYNTFGLPFLIKIQDGEVLPEVRGRIQKKLEISEKEFEKWKVVVVVQGKVAPQSDADQPQQFYLHELIALNAAWPSKVWLGLEHQNRAPKRARYSYMEKAIKIHN